jgi:hypothetical protein
MSDLASIRTFPQLVKYLRDELDWPITSDDFEDLTFDYTPQELGIDTKSAAEIEEIKRLRALSVNQPWGVFFVKFEPKRLPIVALRRILSSVALKRRASSNGAERKAWEAEDLLFISSYGSEGDGRQITFAHFSRNPGKRELPTLKVLGWDNLDTPLHIHHVASTLHEHLHWPRDEANVQMWRAEWGGAFDLRYREVVTTSRALAIRLAELARAIRNRITSALSIETADGPLTALMRGFRQALVHDLDAEGFADMYAQTIAYGLLSARIANPQADTADDLVEQVPLTSPFLKELMETFLQAGGRRVQPGDIVSLDFDELGVSEVVGLLDRANMEAVVRDFGDRNPEEDPVVHFYELFLKEYDPKKRMQRGVFYTPRPVVAYIVRSVHRTLQADFGLTDGLADVTTWGDMALRDEALVVPAGVQPSDPFVMVLDPATGTGTFLVEAIAIVHQTLLAKWRGQGCTDEEIGVRWNEYVPTHLLPRLHGYELLMAPYAIAHLKVGLKLLETGYTFGSAERTHVYLTNSLEPAVDFSGQFGFAIPALAHEAQAVNALKRDRRFTVILGNPPYSNYSANLSVTARRIVDPYRTFGGAPIRERNQLQFERNLQDDFVKFVAIAEAALERTGQGILAFITNATLLSAPSLRGAREHLLHTFQRVQELHLHGGLNERTVETASDENVFDISQAVAIHLYARLSGRAQSTVMYAELIGPRSEKYRRLLSEGPEVMLWQPIEPDGGNCGFTPQDAASNLVVQRLPDVFVRYGAGIKTNRDAIAIGFTRAEVRRQIAEFAPELDDVEGSIERILYRPYDSRWVYYAEGVVASRSLPTMQHMLDGPNIAIVASSSWTTPERFSVNAAASMVEMKTGTHDRGTTLFPLYRYEGLLGAQGTATCNLTAEFVAAWCRRTGTTFLATGHGDQVASSGPEDVFCWLYALFHAPLYRSHLRGALAQGFPVVLLPVSGEFARAMVNLGMELLDCHLMRGPAPELITRVVGSATGLVEKISYSDETVWLDQSQSRGFAGISPEIWNLRVGGYPVCEKWLKDRKGRKLSPDNVLHYARIVVALSQTMRIMGEIDKAIEEYGGWPSAFVADDIVGVESGKRRVPSESGIGELLVADAPDKAD